MSFTSGPTRSRPRSRTSRSFPRTLVAIAAAAFVVPLGVSFLSACKAQETPPPDKPGIPKAVFTFLKQRGLETSDAPITFRTQVPASWEVDLAGLGFDQWLAKQGFFTPAGKNSDLITLSPVEVVQAFLQAIDAGDKTRAQACLSPQQQLHSLTVNMDRSSRLYNPEYSSNNSLVENIMSAYLTSYRFIDPNRPSQSSEDPGGSRAQTVEIAAQLVIKWRDEAFNTPSGQQTRFFILNKYGGGWKIEGMGTGP